MMRGYRSVLFVPGNKPAWVPKAMAAGPDAIVLDLEDSVPEGEKQAARALVREAVEKLRATDPAVGIFVRVNSLATRQTGADLEAVVTPGLTGIFAPKIETATDVLRLDTLLDHFEIRNGIVSTGTGGLCYIIPVETVPAIQNCREIAAASPRVGAMIGPTAEHADIAREVGFEWTPAGLETLYLRSRVLLACREAGIHALTALWERVDDLDGLREFARQGRGLGFRGMIAIHPRHVPVINEVFAPSAADIEFYAGLAAAYEEAAAAGRGAARYRGLHIDKAHYDKAVQWLAQARSAVGRATGPDGEAS
jgi:citrate lyase subunit beta/citryl-CoA lyase